MEKERAKELLKSIHTCQESGCQEDCDAACVMLEKDPELQGWFESEFGSWSEVDSVIAAKMECCDAPAGLKEKCKTTQLTRTGPRGLLRFLVPATAAAALLIVGFFVLGRDGNTGTEVKPLLVVHSGADATAFRSDTSTFVSTRAFSLQHEGTKVEDMKTWLEKQGGPVGAIRPCIDCKDGLGCAVLAWGEHEVSMICIKDTKCGGDGVVHIFVIERSAFEDSEVDTLVARQTGSGELDTGGWADDDKVYLMVGDQPDVKLDSLL